MSFERVVTDSELLGCEPSRHFCAIPNSPLQSCKVEFTTPVSVC